MSNGNPLDEQFDTIDAKDFSADVEKAEKLRDPVEKGTYKLKVVEYRTRKSSDASKHPGTPMVSFETDIVEDSNPDYNGKKIFSQNFMLVGPGVSFFTDFAEAMTPGRKWNGKDTILEKDGKSKYLGSFIGCVFLADVGIREYEGKMSNEMGLVRKV